MARIVVVDDEIIIAMQMEERLRLMGYEVAGLASSGNEALRMVRDVKPHIVLMDVVMPGELDGIAAAEIISKEMDIPVIFLTAYSDCRSISQARNAEPFGYLVKPCQEQELKAAIEIALYKKEMERRLRESEERYRLIVETAHEGVWSMDGKCITTYVNKRMAGMLGYSPEEMVGKPVMWFMFDEDLGDHEEKMAGRRKGETAHYERRFRRNDGSECWCLVSATALHDKDGAFAGSFAMFSDITDRKNTERALGEQANFIGQMVDTIPNPVFFKDAEGRYLGCNRAFEEYTGLKREKLVGKSVYDIVSSGFAEKYEYMDGALFGTPGIQTYETLFSHSDGTTRNVIFNKATFLNTRGQVGGLVGVILDVTEQKKANEALADSYRRTYLLFENIPIGMFHSTPEGKFIFANPALASIMGYDSPAEIIDVINRTSVAEAVYEDPGRRPMLVEEVERDGGNWKTFENRYRRKDGRVIDATLSFCERTDIISGERCLYGFVEDITFRKNAEEKLKSSLREKEVLLQEIHHRVKNNMQVISSLLDLQMRQSANEEVREVFKDSQHRIRSMALVHEKLYKSQDFGAINFGEYVKSLAGNLFRSYKTDPRRIVLETDTEDVPIHIDMAIPCGLILNELVANSLKHAFPNTMTGLISVMFHGKGEDGYLLSVRDTGIGIPQDMDLRNAVTLGMRLVFMLAEDQLKGSVEVIQDHGTEVRVRFGKTLMNAE